MEEQKKREEHEELTKKCRTEKESSKKRKYEGKMWDKWPKRAQENQEKSTCQTHLNRTCGIQKVKH